MNYCTELYNRLDMARVLDGWLNVEPPFSDGLVAGMALAIAAFLILWLVARRLRGRKVCRNIVVPGDKGNLVISINALREFITRILYDFDEASLSNVSLKQHRDRILLDIDVAVVPQTNLIPLRDVLQARIMQDAQDKLGIQTIMKVDITIKSMEANERKIAKKSGKASGNTGHNTRNQTDDFESEQV